MRRLFEEFRIAENQLLKNLRQQWKVLFIKSAVEERDCEFVVE